VTNTSTIEGADDNGAEASDVRNDNAGRDRRSSCPISSTLDIMGDKWSLLIVRDIILGKSRFNEFLASPEKVTTNILAERLKRLERHGVISRTPYQQNPVRYAYQLTDKGRALAPILRAVIGWANAWEPETFEPPEQWLAKLDAAEGK
jgi:DNA-binding HxlR family transcriptional regulator